MPRPTFIETLRRMRRERGDRANAVAGTGVARAEETDETDQPVLPLCPECGAAVADGECSNENCTYADPSMAEEPDDDDETTPEDGASGPGPDKNNNRSLETTMAKDNHAVAPPSSPSAAKPIAAGVKELREAFPDDPAFALECAEQSLSLVESKAKYADVLMARMKGQAEASAKAAAEKALTEQRLGGAGTEGIAPIAGASPARGGGGGGGAFVRFEEAVAHYRKQVMAEGTTNKEEADYEANLRARRNHRDLFDQWREEQQAARMKRDRERLMNPAGA